ncbi:MAG: MFS transporter [Angustibacter sp.]
MTTKDQGSTRPVAEDAAGRRERRSWYVYDWANSAYVTTTQTVLFAPYLTTVARRSVCGEIPADQCEASVSVLGLPVSPGSLVFYAVTVSTMMSALVLPVIGALVDRSPRQRWWLAAFAWVGAAAAAAMWFVQGTNWQLGVGLLLVAGICLGASLVVYDAILVQIAGPDERDAVSSRGWALGYLGGFLLLVINLALVTGHDRWGLSEAEAVRWSLLTAGAWWAAFTLVPVLGLRDRPAPCGASATRSPVRQTFGQVVDTMRHLRRHPQTLRFLVAYLFFNDGIQTVIGVSSVYGAEQLGFTTGQLVLSVVVVQAVAIGGALMFGRISARYGARDTICGGLVLWAVVVAVGFFLPRGQLVGWLMLAVLIGLVLGGTQALSRSLFSHLVPADRPAEYFSLYQACERGTSWLGTLVFGLVHQLSGSYRPAIVALLAFFVIGGLLLRGVDVRRGIAAAGNQQPHVV